MFSEDELSFLSDPSPMLLKLDIFKKLDILFGEVQLTLKSVFSEYDTLFPVGTDQKRGKISKGENYLGLPWMMLDFPALFSKTSTFAIRNFCWWGNHFACYILIGGEALELYKNTLLTELNPGSGISFIQSNDPWKHKVEANELRKLDTAEIKRQIEEYGFIKLYATWPLFEAGALPPLVKNFVTEAGLLAGFLIEQHPDGKVHP